MSQRSTRRLLDMEAGPSKLISAIRTLGRIDVVPRNAAGVEAWIAAMPRSRMARS
ncbi:MAG: hypothetical protein U5N53_26065 [Mycobacterium sp.]|nr:hypothetical protein [Mycobacterium sp.]